MATLSTNFATGTDIAPNRTESAAPTYIAVIFILSLVVPIMIRVGPVLLMPHRIVLLLVFIPCLVRLLSGKAGGIIPADWLMFASTIWAMLALMVNHGVSNVIEPAGIHMVEFFGPYLVARVSIRSSKDFKSVVKCIFIIALVLLPLAALESLSKRNFILEKLPNSFPIVFHPYRWGMRRAQTLFAHPIHFGLFAAFGLGIFWYCLGPAWKRVAAVCAAIASTVFSLSSGALIAVVCQLAFIGWEATFKSFKARWKTFASIFAALYVFLELASNRGFFVLLVSYASFNTGSAYNRVLIWQFGMENVWANPIFGLGLREWARPSWMSQSADNFWLLLTMLYGIPAFLFFASAIALLMYKTIKTPLSDPADWACKAGFLTLMGAIIIGGGTVHYWAGMMALVMFFFGSGAWVHTGGKIADIDPNDLNIDPDPQTSSARSRYTRAEPVVRNTPITPKTPAPTQVAIPREKTPFRRSKTLHDRRKEMRTKRQSKET